MKDKLDNIAAGIIIGIIVPAIFFYFFVYPKINLYSFLEGDLYKGLIMKTLPIFLSRCIFPNALLFFFLLWTDYEKAAKGVLIITGIVTAVLLFINFVL